MSHKYKIITEKLHSTFEDSILSRNERRELDQLLEEFAGDIEALRFAHKTAFDILEKYLETSGNDKKAVFNWLKGVMRAIEFFAEEHPYTLSEAFFSPGDGCRDKIISSLEAAKKCVDICVFTISDNAFAEAIFDVQNRKIPIRIITDDDKSHDRGSDIHKFIDRKIPVRMDNSPDHMHHKFAVIDKKILINGSFNWTRSASERNEENVLVTRDPALVRAFQEKFEELWQRFGA
ncbi:MAG: nuclease [Deferribacteres bacterium]|nr:nuclease [candidate division KSB1 bacterium]MCB9503873.1 nuclease [Deferribacteres bacterium]